VEDDFGQGAILLSSALFTEHPQRRENAFFPALKAGFVLISRAP
jgi:hypothetical protein